MNRFKLLSTTLLSAALMSGAAMAQPGNLTVQNDAEIRAESDAGIAADRGVDMRDAETRAAAQADTGVMADGNADMRANIAGEMTAAEEFAAQAAAAGKYELESSKLAIKHAENESVKKFAQQMIVDHNKANAQLRAALAEGGLQPALVNAEPEGAQQQKLDELQGKVGAPDFDEEYMDAQEIAHDRSIKLFEDYAENGQNTALRDYASKTLPKLQQHREQADMVEKEVATWR